MRIDDKELLRYIEETFKTSLEDELPELVKVAKFDCEVGSENVRLTFTLELSRVDAEQSYIDDNQ